MYELGIKRLWFLAIGFVVTMFSSLMVFIQPANALAITWDGDAALCGDAFDDTDCWVGGLAPTDGDSVVFDTDSTTVFTTPIDQNIVGLDLVGISVIGAAVDTVTISGTDSTTLNGNITAAQPLVLDFPLVLAGAANINPAATGSVTIDGTIGLGANDLEVVDETVTINGAISGTGTLTVSSGTVVYGGDISSTGGITINGLSSVVTFTGTISAGAITQNNGTVTYGAISSTGVITVVDGTANFGGAMSGATGNVVVTDGIVNFDGLISKAAGDFTINGGVVTFAGTNIFGGNVAIAATAVVILENGEGLGNSTGTTTVASGSQLQFRMLDTTNVTIDEIITFGGPGLGTTAEESAFYIRHATAVPAPGSIVTDAPDKANLTFSGLVTLSADSEIYAEPYYYGDSTTVTFANLAGAFTLTPFAGNGATIVKTTGAATLAAATAATTTVSVTDATVRSVMPNAVLVVNTGITTGNVTVVSGGTLTGHGTVGTASFLGGTFDPGSSPGCFATGNLDMDAGSTLDQELLNTTVCTGYDRVTVTGTVDITGATLNLVELTGYVHTAGSTFTIIDNDLVDAIVGTFAGYAQGATITVGTHTYTISYTGGSGNDVVLTATVAPAAPNTGFGPLSTSYMAVFILTLLASGTLFTLAYIEDRKKN